ncbi:hypothetical protein BDZ89DRAFT_1127159 [Hymenopellis radicata]|nr:hypothetical protein BDZ89DRAFT_1127159 [Hymenopellis radicata]
MANPQDPAHHDVWTLLFAKYQTHLDELGYAIQSFAEAAKVSQHDNVVLLAIDEYHTLDKATDRRTLFVIFLSTFSPSREAVAPPAKLLSSARVVSLPRVQLDPYVAFPFDITTPIITENERTLDDVSKAEFLCLFGRPLWMTRYKCGRADVRRDLVFFARAKLSRSGILQDHEDDSMFAALSTRLLLDFVHDRSVSDREYQAAREFEQRQVAFRMRTVHSIPSHGHYMRTGTPSEPILAEVSFFRMAQNNYVSWRMNSALSSTKASAANCYSTSDIRYSDEDITFSRPIPLIDFLKALVAPQWHDLSSRPKGGGAPFREAFADSFVHFTHWAKMGDASCLSTSALWMAAARGIVWQCCDDMEGVDQIMPIVRGKDVKLGRGHVSALVIRDRNVRTPAVTRLTRKFGATLFADAPDGAVKPYIVLTMQLGGRSAPRATQASSPSTTTPLTSTRKSLQYDVTIHGCSSTVYSVVNDEDLSNWGRLLSRKSFENEHPRGSDTKHLELLRRSKPFFGEDEASFDWAKDEDDGCVDEEEQILEDSVTVGNDGEG